MDDSMKRDIESALLGQELTDAAESGARCGAFAGQFVKGVLVADDRFTVDAAIAAYGAYIEGMATGNHCHHGESEGQA